VSNFWNFPWLVAYFLRVSRKSAKIAAMIEQFRGREFEAHYLAYFDCFNQQLFYEAHDVLEEMWLPQRKGPNGSFFKGLIQLAGAFVHLQKERLRPAAALFKLAQGNLRPYPAFHEGLSLPEIWSLIENWLAKLEQNDFQSNPLSLNTAPKLKFPAGKGPA
jgi:predicted metal-dependent hydrolase